MKKTYPVYKKDDEVRCIDHTCEPDIVYGNIYKVLSDSPDTSDTFYVPSSTNGGRVCYFKSRFEPVNKSMSLGEQVELAQSFIGKRLREKGKNQRMNCDEVQVCLIKDQVLKRSNICYEYFEKHGFCVAILSGSSSQPVVNFELWPEYETIELTKDYSAVVTKDEIVVGCQTIPMDKVREILKIADNL